MPAPSVSIARCPEHGLHGERSECFICGGPVEQVPLVTVDAVVAWLRRDYSPVGVALAESFRRQFGETQ